MSDERVVGDVHTVRTVRRCREFRGTPELGCKRKVIARAAQEPKPGTAGLAPEPRSVKIANAPATFKLG